MKENEGQKKEKKPGTLSVLMGYVGSYRWLTVLGCVLSAVAMVANMVPYVCIWLVARDLVAVAPDWGRATRIGLYGCTRACGPTTNRPSRGRSDVTLTTVVSVTFGHCERGRTSSQVKFCCLQGDVLRWGACRDGLAICRS